jgi:hypothetical protein
MKKKKRKFDDESENMNNKDDNNDYYYDNTYNYDQGYYNNTQYFYNPNQSKINKFETINKSKHYDTSKNMNKKEKSNNQFYTRKRFMNTLYNLRIRKEEIQENTMYLINGLIDQSIECLICHDEIKYTDQINQCTKCFNPLHLDCLYNWIKKNNPRFDKEDSKQKIELKWTCPHCNYLFNINSKDLPTYNCYCLKYNDPKYSRFID